MQIAIHKLSETVGCVTMHFDACISCISSTSLVIK